MEKLTVDQRSELLEILKSKGFKPAVCSGSTNVDRLIFYNFNGSVIEMRVTVPSSVAIEVTGSGDYGPITLISNWLKGILWTNTYTEINKRTNNARN